MAKLYLGNLVYTVTEIEIRDFFHPLILDKVNICTDRDTGRPKGFAFVEVGSTADAEEAIRVLHGTELRGRAIVVNFAVEKPRGTPPTPRNVPRPSSEKKPDRKPHGTPDRGGFSRDKKKGGGFRPRRESDYE
jgi:RNA recognition motif-containing protein